MVGRVDCVVVRGGVAQPLEQVAALVLVEMLVQITFVPLHVFAVADAILDCSFLEPVSAITPMQAAKIVSELGFHHAVCPSLEYRLECPQALASQSCRSRFLFQFQYEVNQLLTAIKVVAIRCLDAPAVEHT